MYFMILDNILFRQYNDYGYITDNSMFGYGVNPVLGEKYVSHSGSIMLGMLGRSPKHIDTITEELTHVFDDVSRDDLKHDVLDFFMMFVRGGYLAFGETPDLCMKFKPSNLVSNVHQDEPDTFALGDAILRSIHIEIANACNERCLHCFIPHEYKTTMIEPELLFRVVEQGIDMNIIHVTLSGGEPLMHKDILSFLAKCRELDLAVNVLSNLTLLTDEIIAEMKRNPLLSVQSSLYSMTPKIHEAITQVKGSFELTKNNLQKLHDAGIPLQISCPVIKQNKDTFIDVVNWAWEYDIPVKTEYVIFGAYDRSLSNLSGRLSLDEAEKAFDLEMYDGYADFLQKTAAQREALNDNVPVCSVCRNYFGVSAEGYAFPCAGWQSLKIGDLHIQSVREIWEASPEVQRLRNIRRGDFPKCVSCEDRGYCTICMMSNDNETGDAFSVSEFRCKNASMIHRLVRE